MYFRSSFAGLIGHYVYQGNYEQIYITFTFSFVFICFEMVAGFFQLLASLIVDDRRRKLKYLLFAPLYMLLFWIVNAITIVTTFIPAVKTILGYGSGTWKSPERTKIKDAPFLDKQPVVFMVLPNIFAYNKKLVKSSKDGKSDEKRMKPLIWPIAVSSIFLLGQTAFAETSEPAQTEPSTTISSSGAENGASETEMTSNVPTDNSGETISSSEDTSINSSTSSDQIDHLQDLENKRKELEEALEAAKTN